jgi:hypothetical protein
MRSFFAGNIRRPVFAALLAAGGLAVVSTSPAKAQLFNFLFNDAVRPEQVERMLEMRGLEPIGPIVRNGEVYIVDVALPSGRQQRLIIDAYDGRILEQFRVAVHRFYGEASAPRPPSDVGGEMGEHAPAPTGFGAPAPVTYGDSVATRGDSANLFAAPPGGDDADSKARTKSQAKHKKIELTPMATQPSTTSPAPAAKPAATQASTGAPAAADVKPAPASAPTPAATPNPAPKANGGGKAINDVPVEPLN